MLPAHLCWRALRSSSIQDFKYSRPVLFFDVEFGFFFIPSANYFFTHVVLQGTPPCAVSVKIAILTTTVPLQVIATLAFAGQQPLSDIEPQGVA
jgi:hypothetical protein